MSKVTELTSPYDGAPLECDGMTRVLHTVLMKNRMPHVPMVGGVEWNGKKFTPHFWIDLPSGNVVDYRLRMWFGPGAPHGVFDPRKEGVIYTGHRANMPPLPGFLFEVLTGRPIEAGFKDIVEKVVKRVRDSELAKVLIEKVRRYIQTQNPADDLTPAEVAAIYRGEEYGDDFDMPGGQELDVGWTNHAEYRCDLRDVDPSRVNEAVRNFAETHPHKHQKVNLTNHNMGKAVVDVNTQSDPEAAHVVTVMASGNDLKKQLVDRANKVKSAKVKKYVHDGLLRKVDQAGDAAPAWMEKLEVEFKNLKPKGLMEGFEAEDFDDLWYVITGAKRETKKAADALLKPGAGNGGDDEDSTHHWKLGGKTVNTEKMAERIASSVIASKQRHCEFYLAVNGKWYMELADEEYGEHRDSTTYGPFDSFELADKFLGQFSNPGGFNTDDNGTHPVPTRSPNGQPVQKPTYHGRGWYP